MEQQVEGVIDDVEEVGVEQGYEVSAKKRKRERSAKEGVAEVKEKQEDSRTLPVVTTPKKQKGFLLALRDSYGEISARRKEDETEGDVDVVNDDEDEEKEKESNPRALDLNFVETEWETADPSQKVERWKEMDSFRQRELWDLLDRKAQTDLWELLDEWDRELMRGFPMAFC